MGKRFVYEDFEKEWHEFNPHMKISYTEKPVNIRDAIHCYCDICGGDYDSTCYNLQTAMKRNSKHKGCRICSDQMIVAGINDLLTKAPHIEKYVVDKEYARTIGVCPNNHSHRKIKVKCDICGYETDKNIYDLVRYGMACPRCSDGFSIPNKIIRILLDYFRDKMSSLLYEYQADWTQSKKYDAYFEVNGNRYVVEMDGEQHTRDAFYHTHEWSVENDNFKDALAENNGVKMIRIDCSSGKFSDIKKSIANSELAKLFVFTDEVWNRCKDAYNSNLFLKVIEDRKQGMTMKFLTEKYHLGRSTVLRYLHKGEDLGLLRAFKENGIMQTPHYKV